LVQALNQRSKAAKGARVVLLGIAYKKNVDDCRESPAFPIMEQLERLGVDLCFHDARVVEIPPLREWPQFTGRRSLDLTPTLLAASDAVLIVTDHDAVDYGAVLEHAPLVVDSRGVYPGTNPKVVKA
jgi:UDP-N-acetyl-D-glucosamine dehydrogenase